MPRHTTTTVPVLAFGLALVLTTAGCPSNGAPTPGDPQQPESGPAPASAPAEPVSVTPVAIEGREVPVKCGCKLEVKKCSEWAEVDGRWVRLVGDHGMGSMPFCGKEGLKARVSGQLQGDELRFTSLEMVP